MKVHYMDRMVQIEIQEKGVRLLDDYHFTLVWESETLGDEVHTFRIPHQKWRELYDGSSVPPILSIALGQKLDWANACAGTVHDALWDGVAEVKVRGRWVPVWFSPEEADDFYQAAHRHMKRPGIAAIDWLGVRAASIFDMVRGWFYRGPRFVTWDQFSQRYPNGVKLSEV